ncbi:hypothetical protein HNQ93_003047 [Hymenobacter luteus]|uniref:DUF3575 domain-containing protein n=2 Tax=Hymenobacter TaxID=89966 RepID=A0A7W9T243_9BACT|nr:MULTISPECIES: hypothetical protein [Hymenobacter]MBB4603283.1 hypothetical protein [Hymenobacter latericoloratus]MBB6060181.1 hypothetical protein [Hymenobacter luteus]
MQHRSFPVIATVILLGSASDCLAQSSASADSIRGRNIIRLDIGGPLGYTAEYNFMRRYFKPIVPVLLSYERVVKPRVSIGGEALLWGGGISDVRWGAGAQGRYYFWNLQPKAEELYIAGTLHYRRVRTDLGYRNWWQHWAGPGVSMGWQAFSRSGWGFDLALGVNFWVPLSADAPPTTRIKPEKGMYEKNHILPDGRVGVAYRWGASRR